MSGFDLNAKMIQKPFENEFGKLVQKKEKGNCNPRIETLLPPFTISIESKCRIETSLVHLLRISIEPNVFLLRHEISSSNLHVIVKCVRSLGPHLK